jgi:hypothetical protein
VIVAVIITAMSDAPESPAIHLASKGRVSSVAEEERDDAFFKGLLLENSPRATMWQPGNDILVFSIGKNHVKLGREGGFLVSSSRGALSAPSGCSSATSMFLRENARVVPVRARVCASASACALSIISSNTGLGV